MRVPSLTPRRLIKALEQFGFVIDHQSGSHVVLRHPDGRRAMVARHNQDLKRGTLLGIIKQAGYTPGEFLELFRNL